MSGGVVFDLWALAFGVVVAGVAGLALAIRHRHGPRPFDWKRDGECDNRSHPRIVP